jgi:hypothetical protein
MVSNGFWWSFSQQLIKTSLGGWVGTWVGVGVGEACGVGLAVRVAVGDW